MKCKFNKDALRDAIGLIVGVVPTRTPKPILECVKITIENDIAEFFATNTEIGISVKVFQIECETPGTIVIPAGKFASIIRESRSETINIESNDASIVIKSGSSKFTMYGYSGDQFPNEPKIDGESCFKITPDNLKIGISSVIHATSKSETRYGLQGPMWDIGDKSIIMVATDGKRLAKIKCDISSVNLDIIPKRNIIIPAKTLSLLMKIADSSGDEIAIKFINHQIVFDCGSIHIVSNLIDGRFPAYDSIIPEKYTTQVTLNCNDIISASKSASLLANDDSKGICLEFANNNLKITGRSPETGNAEIDIDIEVDGPENKISLNPTFLIDAVNGCMSSDFVFEFQDNERPCVIKCGGNYICVIMPVNG